MADSLDIVVPAFDEAGSIMEVVQELSSTEWGIRHRVFVVNDGSRDDTSSRLQAVDLDQSRVSVLEMPVRRGRGAAIRQAASEGVGSILAFHDADKEYSASDLQRLLSFVVDGKADAVLGSRHLGPGRAVVQYWRSFGQRLVTLWSNALTDLNLTDATTSCLVIRRSTWETLELTADGFDIDVEIVAALARARARVWEVPVEYAGRRRVDGRKSRRRDVAYRLVRVLRSRLRGDRLLREART